MTFRWLGLAGIMWALLACSGTPETKISRTSSNPPPHNYVGIQIPPMPEGSQTELGYLLETENPGKFSIEVVNVGSLKAVWMGSFLYHDDQGKAHWKVIAALPPRPLPEGYYFSSGNCMNRGNAQPEIVAIIKKEDKKMLTGIKKAWRADPQKKHFEELPPAGIQCINEGWNSL